MEMLFTVEGMISLLTLTILEIILGIDNIIFISIVSSKLPEHQQDRARTIGILMALLVRIALLFGITWLISLKEPLLTINFLENFHIDPNFSGRDLILLAGGLFLLTKSVSEIHHKVEGDEHETAVKKVTSLMKSIIQIVLIDVVFSFDSILTAVGLVDEILIMIVAVVISLGIMLVFSKKIADFINRHPSIQLLALSFLVLIGFLLVIEGFGEEVPKGYVYFAMAFAFSVELLNMRMEKKVNEVEKKEVNS
ncbi:TerC family protein [Limibacter armeniacum]|uniref:TerC family protein n=1 Tax=Limibacter armeniacum TaxID=466084 RepID=UPI002FE6446C